MASVGHICDLPQSAIGVAPPDYRPSYVITKGKEDRVAQLAQAAKNASEVFLATDPDREGEAISWHIARELKLKNSMRVTFNEITAKAVKAAVQNPRKLDMGMVAAQETRRVIDRLVGYRVSPAVCNALAGRYSAGRVQSPALRLVVERELEIRNFKSIDHYRVRATFEGGWSARWDMSDVLPKEQKYLTDRALAQQVANDVSRDPTMKVLSVTGREAKRNPPPPFITSTLLRAASSNLGYSPEVTMKLAQTLFEEHLITYHRTDSPSLSEEGEQQIRVFLEQYGRRERWPEGFMPDKPNRWKAVDSAQGAHEAVRPVDVSVMSAAMISQDADRLYRLIRDRALACQMSAARDQVTNIVLESSAHINGKPQKFVATGRVETFPGFRLLWKTDEEEGKGEDQGKLPPIQEGSRQTAQKAELEESKTQPPPRYSEAGLVEALESHGIGRPSTYASIMSVLYKRGYIVQEKKTIRPTDIGEKVADWLLKSGLDFYDVEYTARIEKMLDDIAAGRRKYIEVVTLVDRNLPDADDPSKAARQAERAALEAASQHKCPVCKSRKLLRRESTKKPGVFWWGCAGYPACSAKFSDDGGKPGKPF